MNMKMPKFHYAGWKRRISLVLIFTMILSIFSNRGLFDPQSADAAISYGSAGALSYASVAATTIVPAYPASIASGDLLVLIIGMKPNTANSGSVTTPAGWNLITSIIGAGGYGATLGADTGNTNLFAYYKVAAGTESGSLGVTLDFAGTTTGVAWAQIYRITKTTGEWSVAGATGSDTTGDVTVSIAFSTNPGVAANDFIIGAMCIPTDVTTPAQFSAENFTQTGVTFGTRTEISEPDSTGGNDIGGFTVYAPVTAGSGTANPTMTATAGGTVTAVRGPGVFIRMREAAGTPPTAGTVTVSPSSNGYTTASPSITTTFTDNESPVQNCQYTTDGSTWVAGTVSGSMPTFTCTANPTGLSGALTINMRGTSGGGTTTASPVNITVDTTQPTDGTLTAIAGNGQVGLSWTAATDSGIGMGTYKLVRGTPTAPADCSGSALYQGANLAYADTAVVNGTQYGYRVCATDAAGNGPSAGSAVTATPSPSTGRIASCSGCHDYPPQDGARSGATGAVVGSHQPHNKPAYVCSICHVVPATESSADFGHRDGMITMQPSIQGGAYTGGTHAQTTTPSLTSCTTNNCHGGASGNTPTPVWGGTTPGCVTCHNGVVTALNASALSAGSVTQRRAIVPEFKNAWSHKRSTAGGVPANTVVNNTDCGVCHMEGSASTGASDPAYHANGTIELRDPDLGTQIMEVSMSGDGGTWNQTTPHTAAGSYSSTATPLSFVQYGRDLNVRMENDASWQISAAIQINQCLKCHDNNGANNAASRVGVNGLQPFGVAITGHVAPYDSNGNGNVVDVNKSFATTNASYHPIRGRGNNSYTQGSMMQAFLGMAKTTGNNTQFGYLISCWDCHAPSGASGVQNMTVTAHGATATLRGAIRTTGTDGTTNLCLNCHATNYSQTVNDNHGTGSAFGTGGSSSMNTYFNNCSYCHAYAPSGGTHLATTTQRPLRAEDVHGFDDRTAGTVGSVWGSSNAKPYAFFRMHMTGWKPLSGATVPAGTPTCGGSAAGNPCNDNMTYGSDTYTPGGAY